MTHHKHDSHYHQHGSDKGFELETPLHTLASITREQRECMISEAAYYMAEHRHFQGGDPIHDWLQAQMEIDSKIKNASH